MSRGKFPNKIIGVGFQKTGTSSLRDALRILGYKVGDNNYQMLWPILHGNYNRVFNKLNQYDAAEDNPWPLIYKEIDQQIPNCKFILTIRESESWYKSVARHIGNLRSPMHEWIYGFGKGLPKDFKQNTIEVYNRHNQEVKVYFKNRPNDLLVVDFTTGAGWEELCNFLQVPIPKIPFPHANNKNKERKGKPTLKRRFKILKKRVKYWFQIKYYRAKGFI